MMEQTAYATATPVLYELSGVEKSCEGPAERITILKNMDLTVRAGESLAIVGASGSGKSTLLHLLGALDTPTAGKVLFEGKSLPDMTPVEKAHFRNKKLGFVFQFHHLLPEFSTEENVAMQALIAGMNRSKALGLARTRRAFRQEGSQGNHPFRRRASARRHCAGYPAGAPRAAGRRADRQLGPADRRFRRRIASGTEPHTRHDPRHCHP